MRRQHARLGCEDDFEVCFSEIPHLCVIDQPSEPMTGSFERTEDASDVDKVAQVVRGLGYFEYGISIRNVCKEIRTYLFLAMLQFCEVFSVRTKIEKLAASSFSL